MNVTNTTLNRLMQKHNIKSDYALAKLLKVGPGSLSNWRKGKSQMADPIAIRAATLLGVEPGAMLAQLQEERATDDTSRKLWRQIADRLRHTAATLLFGILGIFAGFSHSPAARAASVDVQAMHIMVKDLMFYPRP